MNDTYWTPSVRPDVAYAWLNADTYWDGGAGDPAANSTMAHPVPRDSMQQPVLRYPGALMKRYPLMSQSGQPRTTRLRDALERDLVAASVLQQLLARTMSEVSVGRSTEAVGLMQQLDSLALAQARRDVHTSLLQLAEVRLACGMAYYALNDDAQALACFQWSCQAFVGADAHAEAVTRWLAGILQLAARNHSYEAGLLNLQASWRFFAAAAAEGNRRTRDEVEWYRRRATLMAADLKAAAQAQLRPPAVAPRSDAVPERDLAELGGSLDKTAPLKTQADAAPDLPPVRVGDLLAWRQGAIATVIQVVAIEEAPAALVRVAVYAVGDLPRAGRVLPSQRHDFARHVFDQYLADARLIRLGHSSLPVSGDAPPQPAPRKTRPAPKSQRHDEFDAYFAIPILASAVRGGDPIVVTDSELGWAETNVVLLNGDTYTYHRLVDGDQIEAARSNLAALRDQNLRLVRVTGDSMNMVVQSDEWLVLRFGQALPLAPSPGAIVAARIRNRSVEDEVDTEVTLKVYQLRGAMIELQPRSTNPRYKPALYAPSNVEIRAVAVGVLRRLPLTPN